MRMRFPHFCFGPTPKRWWLGKFAAKDQPVWFNLPGDVKGRQRVTFVSIQSISPP
jgi:hypothetical protein